MKSHLVSRTVVSALFAALLSAIGTMVGHATAQAAGSESKGSQASTPLAMEITPEGVQALTASGTPYELIDAAKAPVGRVDAVGPVRNIYYTTGPSHRAAQDRVILDRQLRKRADQATLGASSQRLTGSPLEWQRLKLKFGMSPVPTEPQMIKPRQFAEALRDSVDLQIIDLRPSLPTSSDSPFPLALRVLPHEVDSVLGSLSRQRWVVVVDDGNRAANPVAEYLFRQGFVLTTILEGGYPAWVSAVDR